MQAPAPDVAGPARVRFLCSLPSAVLAAPEIKIKCGLGRGSGVGEQPAALGFILSIVTSPPNLWHFNYSPTRLLLLGPEGELTLSSSRQGGGTAWTPRPHPAPQKRGAGARAGQGHRPRCSLLLLLVPEGTWRGPGSQTSSREPMVPCVNHWVHTPTAPLNGGHSLQPTHDRPTAHFVDAADMLSACRAGPRTRSAAPGLHSCQTHEEGKNSSGLIICFLSPGCPFFSPW